MRIGLISGEYPPLQGGVGAYSHILARTFADMGHDVYVLASAGATEDDSDIHLKTVPRQWGPHAIQQATQWAKQHHLDLVSLQFETAAYRLSPWVHFLPQFMSRTAFITTFHDLLHPYLFPKAGPLRDWIVMHLARRSDGVIATNHEDYERVKHLDYAQMIPIGSNIHTQAISPATLQSIRAQAGAESDQMMLVHFGFINASKGLETLLHAYARIKNSARLVMIGGRTGTSDPSNISYSQQIDHLIDALHLTDSIYWTGFLDEVEVAAYLQAADAVVLPFRDGASFRRGSLMAALQQGCAIITTTPQVHIDEFTDGDNMLLFSAGNVEELISQIHRLMANTKLQSNLKAGARATSEHFQWDAIARSHVTMFEDILSR